MVIGEAHGHHGITFGLTYLLSFSALLVWIFFCSHGRSFFTWLRRPALWIALLLISAPLIQHHYTANQKKPNPLSTSIALEAPARALLLHGKEMYSVTANGAPISPGPGWILLWSPVTVPRWTSLVGVIALTLLLFLLSRRQSLWAGLFGLLMLLQPQFVSQLLNGQDLYVISLALVTITLLLYKAPEESASPVLLGLLGGVIATSRVPIAGMLALLGFDLWRRNRRSGILFLISVASTTVLFHGVFYLWALRNHDVYQPIHYLSRGSFALAKPVMALLAVSVIVWVLRSKSTLPNWLLGMFLMMAALFTPEGVAEYFPLRHLDWEGSNYVCFPIPVLLAAIVTRVQVPPSAKDGDVA